MKNDYLHLLNDACIKTYTDMQRIANFYKCEVLEETNISEEEFYQFYEVFKTENMDLSGNKLLKYTYITKGNLKIIATPFEQFYIATTFINQVNEAVAKKLKCSVYKSHRCVDGSGEDYPLIYLCIHSDTKLEVYQIDDAYIIYEKCSDSEMINKIKNRIFGQKNI